MKPFSLPSGATGFTNDAGQWICTGSQMGRRDQMPDDPSQPAKLRLIRLPFVDGCYDRWGAYWGSPANVWCATGEMRGEEFTVFLFLRADSREQAKSQVREKLPQAKFYR